MEIRIFVPLFLLISILSACSGSETQSKSVYKTIYSKVLETEAKKPVSIAMDKKGNLYVSNKDEGKIEMIRLSGESILIAENLGAPSSIAFDGFENLYFIDEASESLFFIDKKSNVVKVAEKLDSPSDVVVDRYGRIFVLSSKKGTITRLKI